MATTIRNDGSMKAIPTGLLPIGRRERNQDTLPVAPPADPVQAVKRPTHRGNPALQSIAALPPGPFACTQPKRSGRRNRSIPIERNTRQNEPGRLLPAFELELGCGHESSCNHFLELVWSSAARNPLASFTTSSFAQKCIKNRRGSSWSM